MCCDFEHSPFFRITLQYQSNNTVLMLAFSNGSNITPTNRLNTPKRKKRTQGHPSYTSANYFWQKLAMSTISHYAKKYMHWAIAELVLASWSARATPIKSQQQERVSEWISQTNPFVFGQVNLKKQSSNELRVFCDLFRSVHVDSTSSWMQMGLAGG